LRKLQVMIGGLLTGSGVVAYAYARWIEPNHIEVTQTNITLPHLSPAFHNYRILQISDIHLDQWMPRRRLMEVVQRVNAQQPDLIVITGDFITGHATYVADDLSEALCQLHAPDGVLAIPGNHDHKKRAEIVKIRQILHDTHVVDLSNSVHTLKRGENMLYIAGVDSMIARKARLDLVLDQMPLEGAAILLAHEPDFADLTTAVHRFDLQLSGHTHGGQIRIPGLGAVRATLPRYGRRYVTGLVKLDDLYVYVNRGLGMVSIPLRFNCPPEIAVLTLKAPV